ncbi:MAG: T9SS type A sorting domain-containing protein [Bacteroidia bacterium]|nr:T9SS type A sorting domain-containing protein [Bacteroidia bacterium]
MKKLILFILLGIVFTGTTAFIISSGGIVNQTGSPGEGTCASCHAGGGGTTNVSISGSPAFVSNQYVPGQTYTININVTNNSFTKFAFGAEILNPSNVNAGNMTTALSGVQIVNVTRKNATHTTAKTGTGAALFQFVWVAPLSGTATIYAAGNAVDGTGGTGGDRTGNSSLVLSPDLSAGINEATVSGISGLNVYPNPIKSEFKISYNVIESANVKIMLYNLQGQEIAEITSENQNAGAHLIEAELPSDLAKGVYFVKLSVNGKQAAQRLIITQ